MLGMSTLLRSRWNLKGAMRCVRGDVQKLKCDVMCWWKAIEESSAAAVPHEGHVVSALVMPCARAHTWA